LNRISYRTKADAFRQLLGDGGSQAKYQIADDQLIILNNFVDAAWRTVIFYYTTFSGENFIFLRDCAIVGWLD
jgi:hypothetical protein